MREWQNKTKSSKSTFFLFSPSSPPGGLWFLLGERRERRDQEIALGFAPPPNIRFI